jgi:hypothetical protein
VSPRASALGYGCGGVLLLVGLTLLAVGSPGGLGPALFGGVILAAIFLEPRYGRPASGNGIGSARMEQTGERFVDDESGELIEVWYDPATGERQYRPVHPRN